MVKSDVVLVDVDNTLFDFATPLYNVLKKTNDFIEEPKYWNSWDFYEQYFIKKTKFYNAVDSVHKYILNYKPFKYSKTFLDNLHKLGYYIIIASHRKKTFLKSLEEWLNFHELTYDEVHISYDKTVMFPITSILIDDNPFTINKADEIGIDCYAISYPWNKNLRPALRYNNLNEIYQQIENKV